jgi:heme-degrading monooxygenase HmoA
MNFPPASPWKLRAAVDPEREYIAFTSAFYLKSLLRVPAFVRRAMKIMKQADAAPGIVGWSLGQNLFKLEFYTLSVWQDSESLRHFVRDGDHLASLAEFEHDMRRKTIFVHYKLFGRDLPASWKDAFARQRQHDAHSKRTGQSH